MKRKTQKRKNSKNEEANYNFGRDDFVRPMSSARNYYNQQISETNNNYTRSEMRKRQNKKRKLKIGVRNTLIAIGIIIAFSALGIALSLNVFFNVSKIKVSGSGIYTEEEIVRMSGIETGENLFLIDYDACAKRLCETLPYVYNVNFKKEFPVTLTIEVTDAVPKFSIQQDDKSYILLDDNLKVLEASADDSHDTVLITQAMVISSSPGFAIEFENGEIAKRITELSDAIKAVNMSEATSLGSIDVNNNYIVYENRITFELGDCNDLENKLYRGLAVCEELELENPNIKGKLDLSYGKESYFTAE